MYKVKGKNISNKAVVLQVALFELEKNIRNCVFVDIMIMS